MADNQGFKISAADLQAHGFAPGSDGEKAILVDIAHAIKEFHAEEKAGKFKPGTDRTAELKRLIHESIAGTYGKNPFSKDARENALIENYAFELLDRSIAKDEQQHPGDKSHHGDNAASFFTKGYKIMNNPKHSMFNDGKLEETISKASQGIAGVLKSFVHIGGGFTKDEAQELAKQLQDVQKDFEAPEREHLGVREKTMQKDFNKYVHDKPERAFAGIKADDGEDVWSDKHKNDKIFDGKTAAKPDDKDPLGKMLEGLGGGQPIMIILALLAAMFMPKQQDGVNASVPDGGLLGMFSPKAGGPGAARSGEIEV